jgi:hypothetical protein
MVALREYDRGGVTRLKQHKPVIMPALAELATGLANACPQGSIISFRFDGKLHVDIDVRGGEQAAMVERVLPASAIAAFTEMRRARSPHPFLLRITAEIDA